MAQKSTWAGKGRRPAADYRAARRNEARSRRVEVLKAQSLARRQAVEAWVDGLPEGQKQDDPQP